MGSLDDEGSLVLEMVVPGDVEDVDKLVPEASKAGSRTRARADRPSGRGGLRQSMGYCGAATIEDRRRHAVHAHHARRPAGEPSHGVTITKDAPNYRR
jgi:IMP dehydrogenase